MPTPKSHPDGLAAGADGNMWFAEQNANKIGCITPADAIAEFAVPSPGDGPDNGMWLTGFSSDKVERIALSP